MKQPQTGEYPDNWDDLATKIKDNAGWRCVRCNHPHDTATGYGLGVHHLDGNKSNCEWWNLPALCQRCHLRIQGKVIMSRVWLLPHSEWFIPYVAGYYAHEHGLPTDKDLVLSHATDLIKLGQAQITLEDFFDAALSDNFDLLLEQYREILLPETNAIYNLKPLASIPVRLKTENVGIAKKNDSPKTDVVRTTNTCTCSNCGHDIDDVEQIVLFRSTIHSEIVLLCDYCLSPFTVIMSDKKNELTNNH